MSKRFSLNKEDVQGWVNQTLRTLAPYLIALIPVVISQIPKEWEYAVFAVWILNRVWDLLRRYISGK